MTRWVVALALLSTCTAGALADYVSDRKAAVALVRAGKHEEALAAFTRLIETAASDVQKCDALRQAALCAEGLKRHDLAMQLAKKIPVAPLSKTCQMQLMESRRQWQEIVEKFKGEDINDWPESVRGDAFFARGNAYFLMKDGEAAARDLPQAVEYLTDGNAKALCLICLGDTYATLLKDDAKAVQAYRRAYGAGNVYKHCEAAMNVAGILMRQRKYGAAVDELHSIKMAEVTAPYWRGRMLSAMGDALAGAGRKADAISRYNEALGINGLPGEIRTGCEMALKKLKMESK